MLDLIIIISLLIVLALTLYAYLLGTAPVPTPAAVVPAMIAAAAIKPGDKVYDLGCGDGRLVFAAAAAGAQATGLEISPLIFVWAYLRKIFKKSPAKILFRDMLTADISSAQIIFLYMYPTTNRLFLKNKFQKQLAPGTKVISLAFPVKGLPLQKTLRAGRHYIFVYQL